MFYYRSKLSKNFMMFLGVPRLTGYIDEEDRIRFLNLLVKEATLVEITEQIKECRDPKDNKFLELAVNGKANCIISGDGDLQVLNPFRKIPVVSPREFLEADL